MVKTNDEDDSYGVGDVDDHGQGDGEAGKTLISSQVRDVACPTDIVFYRHFQLNGSWTEVDVDGRLHVKMIQSSNDLLPPENDQVKWPKENHQMMLEWTILTWAASCQDDPVQQ